MGDRLLRWVEDVFAAFLFVLSNTNQDDEEYSVGRGQRVQIKHAARTFVLCMNITEPETSPRVAVISPPCSFYRHRVLLQTSDTLSLRPIFLQWNLHETCCILSELQSRRNSVLVWVIVALIILVLVGASVTVYFLQRNDGTTTTTDTGGGQRSFVNFVSDKAELGWHVTLLVKGTRVSC